MAVHTTGICLLCGQLRKRPTQHRLCSVRCGRCIFTGGWPPTLMRLHVYHLSPDTHRAMFYECEFDCMQSCRLHLVQVTLGKKIWRYVCEVICVIMMSDLYTFTDILQISSITSSTTPLCSSSSSLQSMTLVTHTQSLSLVIHTIITPSPSSTLCFCILLFSYVVS